jgi:hypothetical protein
VSDNSSLYIELLRNILGNKSPSYGKQGYYLASSGSVEWEKLYQAFAQTLFKRGAVDSPSVKTASDAELDKAASDLGWPRELVNLLIGGK